MTAKFRVGVTVKAGGTYVVTHIDTGYYELFDGTTATVRPWTADTVNNLEVIDAPDPGDVVSRFRVGSVVKNVFTSAPTWLDMTVTAITDTHFEAHYSQAGVEVTRVFPWHSGSFDEVTIVSDRGE